MTPSAGTVGFGLLLALAGAAGCDGGGDTVQTADGARAPGVIRPDGAAPDAFVRPDLGAFEIGQRPDLPPPSPPNAQAKLIAKGRARLVGSHESACSNQGTGTTAGDRWCAFSLPDARIGQTQLWVVNATRAITGNVACSEAAADPNCILLTKNLWTGVPQNGAAHPAAHRFDGDTLIFHSLGAASTTGDPVIYKGPIHAWRPGWAAPKQITGDNGVTCSGHFRADVALCIEDLVRNDTAIQGFTLTAGSVSNGQLKKVGPIVPSHPVTESSRWQASFSRDGQWLAYSTGGMAATDRETLYAWRTSEIGEPSKRLTVASNVSRWAISRDQERWYYLRAYNYSEEGDPSGMLVTSPFPNGPGENGAGTETRLANNVGFFQALSDGTEVDNGVAFYDGFVGGVANLKLMRDVSKPEAVTTIVNRTIGGVISPDLRYAMYSKDFDDRTQLADAHIVKMDGTGGCVLQSTFTTDYGLFGFPFLRSSGLALWVDKIDRIDGLGEAWLANADGCTGRRKWADRVDYWFNFRDEGIVFSDEGTSETATLKYVQVTAGTLGTPVTVQQQITRDYAVLPDFEGVLFTIARGAEFDGLYLYAKLPFGATSTSMSMSTPDGGTAPRAVDAGAPLDAAPGGG